MSELEINYENLSLISGVISVTGVTVGSIVYLTSTAVTFTGKISNQITRHDYEKPNCTDFRWGIRPSGVLDPQNLGKRNWV